MSRIVENTGATLPVGSLIPRVPHRAAVALPLMMVVYAVLVGCSQSVPPEQISRAHSSHSASAASMWPNKSKTLDLFEKGMAYADLRRSAINAGWKPVIDPQCKANVIGSDYKEVCSADTSLESCSICDHLPEVSGCSGDGYCGMYFQRDTEQLHVVSYGMIEDWGVSGRKSRLTVDGWDVSKH